MSTVSVARLSLRLAAVLATAGGGVALFICLLLMHKVEHNCSTLRSEHIDEALGFYNILYLVLPWGVLSLLHLATIATSSRLADATAAISVFGGGLSLRLSIPDFLLLSGGGFGYQCPNVFVDGYELFRRTFFFDDGVLQMVLSGALLVFFIFSVFVFKVFKAMAG